MPEFRIFIGERRVGAVPPDDRGLAGCKPAGTGQLTPPDRPLRRPAAWRHIVAYRSWRRHREANPETRRVSVAIAVRTCSTVPTTRTLVVARVIAV